MVPRAGHCDLVPEVPPNPNPTQRGREEIFDSYEVFLGKREWDTPSPHSMRQKQDQWPSFGNRENSIVFAEEGLTAEQSSQIIQNLKRKLERSDSAEEANYLLKCLNYPNIFHEDLDQPTTSTTSRSDSFASNIMRKLSVSGLAGLPQRSPGEMRRSDKVYASFKQHMKTTGWQCCEVERPRCRQGRIVSQ